MSNNIIFLYFIFVVFVIFLIFSKLLSLSLFLNNNNNELIHILSDFFPLHTDILFPFHFTFRSIFCSSFLKCSIMVLDDDDDDDDDFCCCCCCFNYTYIHIYIYMYECACVYMLP